MQTNHFLDHSLFIQSALANFNMEFHNSIQYQAWFTLRWKSARWTQNCADLWNNLGFSLSAVLPVCCMVTTSDNREKFEIEVSADLVCCY